MNVQTRPSAANNIRTQVRSIDDHPDFRRGGLVHRFFSDSAIREFCQESNVERYYIDAKGGVWAEHCHHYEGLYSVQIGWVG
jgi:hypothetical protein